MAPLRDVMARDAQSITRLEGLGEELQWIPRDGSGAYTVHALVDRRGVITDDDGETSYTSAELVIPNGGTYGLAAAPVPGDGVQLAMTLGGTVVTAKFRALLSQDAAAFTVEVSA